MNCVAVEWKKGVKTPYAQAANNVRVVAAQVAAMITFLMVNTRTSAAPPDTCRSMTSTEDLDLILQLLEPFNLLKRRTFPTW